MITYAELADKHTSLTNKEYLALHGTLPRYRIEALIEMEETISGQEGVLAHIKEASSSFPEKDFLQDYIGNLYALARKLRGANREDLESLIDEMEDLQRLTANNSTYGLEKLKEAKEAIYEP